MTEEVRNVKTIGQTAMKINDYLSADEYIEFQLCRNAQATRILLANWAVIIATFTLIARYTNPASILLGAFILAGRIHGLGVIMHEGSHNSFFKQRILNQILGHWSPAGLPRLLARQPLEHVRVRDAGASRARASSRRARPLRSNSRLGKTNDSPLTSFAPPARD